MIVKSNSNYNYPINWKPQATIQGNIQIQIAMQNINFTFIIGGWVLVWQLPVAVWHFSWFKGIPNFEDRNSFATFDISRSGWVGLKQNIQLMFCVRWVWMLPLTSTTPRKKLEWRTNHKSLQIVLWMSEIKPISQPLGKPHAHWHLDPGVVHIFTTIGGPKISIK